MTTDRAGHVDEALGLGAGAEAVYRLMLTEGLVGPAVLGERLALSECQVAEALSRLVDAGLVRPSAEVEGELRLADPRAGLRELLELQEAELRRSQEQFDRSRAAVVRLLTDYAVAEPGASHRDTERLIGRDTVLSRLERLAGAASFECISFQPAVRATAATEESRSVNLGVLSRGVRIRTVYPDSARRDPSSLEHAGWLVERGAEIRTVPAIPLRMIVVDREVAVLPVDLDPARADAVQITAPGMIAALVALFDSVWSKAVPIGLECPERDHDLTRQESGLLGLLAQGLTDEAIGNKLGLSVRTVRRNIAALMARLGARSRFEAGLRAKERNWL